MGRLTIKLMPVKKEVMCAIMLLPMTLQQCASINYDSTLMPVCFLFVALMFNYKYVRQELHWKDTIIPIILLIVIAITKVPYVLLALLVFAIPSSKIILKLGKHAIMPFIKKYKIFIIAVLVLIFAAGLYVARNTQYIMLLRACILEPKDYLRIMYGTLKAYLGSYVVNFVACFGWLDTPASPVYIVFSMISLLLLAQYEGQGERTYGINKGFKLFNFILAAGMVVLIITIMITWSFNIDELTDVTTVDGMRKALDKVNFSLGVQGRYFIPFAFCGFFSLSLFTIKRNRLLVYQIFYYVIEAVYTVWLVLGR
jgi:uncharacterized membrane protein